VELGNGLTETRVHDQRYHPDRITVAPTGGGTALLDWDYTTDGVGNPTLIDDLLGGVDRDYGYQDVQYFLTQGDGPWGTLDWTYDRIGNRLSESRDGGAADVYGYQPNSGALGNTARLTSIQHGVGGTTAINYDPAGNRIQTNASGAVTDWSYDDASRLSRIEGTTGDVDFFYDGRSFLRLAEGLGEDLSGSAIFCDGFETGNTSVWGTGGETCVTETDSAPVYGSEGILMAKGAAIVLPFGGRPVAVVEGGLRYVTVDHLGTPVLLTSAASAVVWDGGFEPFGRDYAGASSAGVFLRFPGQWEDAAWSAYVPDGAVYNVHRWYEPGPGRYTRRDPFGIEGDLNPYAYSASRPTFATDPMGLKTCIVFLGSEILSMGVLNYFLGSHVALYVDGNCSGECKSEGPFLYDPAGSYGFEHGSGSSDLLTSATADWGFDDFADYHCLPGALVETYCFETTCCEEKKILENVVSLGGAGGPLCSRKVSSGVAGEGPFPGSFGESMNALPGQFRSVVRKLMKQSSGSGQPTHRRYCGAP
jgi:RHS repeat-associated protein